jgi:DNA polymerase
MCPGEKCIVLYLDIETYSSVDLAKGGVYRYAESPDFEVLMCAWSTGGPVEVAVGREQIGAIPGLRDPEVLKVAHNASFERVCFSAFFGLPVGQYLDPAQWEDTAVLAAESGYPRKLGELAKALGVADKDTAGTLLVNWFCKPEKKTGQRRRPEDHPEKWERFVEYCRQDVVSLVEVHQALPGWPSGERRAFLVDQAINDRGITIDRHMATRAIEADEGGRAVAGKMLQDLLGIDNAGSVPQVTKGLANLGLEVPDLQGDTLKELLAGEGLTDPQRQALNLRLEISLVAARKYRAALDACSADDRLRGQFRFFGAHTGRWSSRGVQIQNLPRIAITQIEERILDLKLGFDPEPAVLKALVRSLFTGPFTVVDYSAIEARGLAWLAGETWVLDAFRSKRDIYTETAKRMSTPERPLTRQQGKVAVLALGYQGGVHSLRTMGAAGTDAELQDLVYKYRGANPKIQRAWTTTERVFLDGGQVGRLRVERHGRDRHLVLPSGRPLVYHGVVVAGRGRDRRILFDDPKGFKTDTYGGRLIENATQAVCRDLLAEALVHLHGAGYDTVGHVHDEVIVEGTHPVEQVAKVVCQLPSWAAGFPIDAEGFQCSRYRKG